MRQFHVAHLNNHSSRRADGRPCVEYWDRGRKSRYHILYILLIQVFVWNEILEDVFITHGITHDCVSRQKLYYCTYSLGGLNGVPHCLGIWHI
jgi:hypothetical protein